MENAFCETLVWINKEAKTLQGLQREIFFALT